MALVLIELVLAIVFLIRTHRLPSGNECIHFAYHNKTQISCIMLSCQQDTLSTIHNWNITLLSLLGIIVFHQVSTQCKQCWVIYNEILRILQIVLSMYRKIGI